MSTPRRAAVPADELRTPLAVYLSSLFGERAEVVDLTRLSGGASRETWAVAADVGQGHRELVLRRDPPSDPRPETMAAEAEVLAVAARHGVRVPVVHGHGDGVAEGLGAPFLLMERLEGETIARRLQRDARYASARSVLVEQMATALAAIHAVPPAELPRLPREPDPVARLTALCRSTAERRPVLELGLQWLRSHQPAFRADRVVHGDFRLGNVLVDQDGLRGVLDWELAHIGDPTADLGWLLCRAWRFGAPLPVGGLGTREELLSAYASAGGEAPVPEALHWWEVYATVQWAAQCRVLADRHLLGAAPSLEHAALGRRVGEEEHDVLLVLGHAHPTPLVDVLDAERPRTRTHGQDLPGSDDLLRAVRSFLTGLSRSVDDAGERFHLLVARNVLAVVEREVLLGPEVERALCQSHERLGFPDGEALALALARGELDDRLDEVGAELALQVLQRLRIVNPAHAGHARV